MEHSISGNAIENSASAEAHHAAAFRFGPAENVSSGPFAGLYAFFFIFILTETATRAALVIKSFGDLDKSISSLLKIFTTGFLFDAAACSYFLIPLALYLAFIPEKVFRRTFQKYFICCIFFFIIFLLVFTAFAEYFFWDEFEVRFNFVAVDYLLYQREVTDNIIQSYPLGLLLSAIAIISAMLFLALKKRLPLSLSSPGPYKKRLLLAGAFMLLPLMSFVYIDDSFSCISVNAFNNNLAGNGFFAFFHALRNGSSGYEGCYVSNVTADVFKELRAAVKTDNAVFTDSAGPAYSIQRALHNSGGEEKRYNVVLIVLESLSAKFLGAFKSAENLTPNLDELARQGVLYKNFYATGTRTVRGLEAIALSVPPLPGDSIIKRPHNENLFTIGTVFKSKGYETKFLYGGYGYFDNMNYFFSGNGFAAIDRNDFAGDEINFKNAWGVCDEDVYRKAIKEAGSSYSSGKNFFLLALTTSNHRPFTYPEGKIDIPPGTGRKGGVKYADYAIGEFIKEARTMPWFDSTLFIFVADHCARSGGKSSVPVENYKIPLIMYGPRILKPEEVAHVASQIDLAPTVFDILNWSYASNFFGMPVLKMKKEDERMFISNHLTLGYMQDNLLAVLSPNAKAATCRVDPETLEEHEIEDNNALINKAVSYYQGASFMYNQLLR